MEQVKARELGMKRFMDALRILRHENTTVGNAYAAFLDMPQHNREAIVNHSIDAVWHQMNREIENARNEASNKQNKNERDEDEQDEAIDHEAAEALIAIMRTTAWSRDRTINEAVKFLRMALQQNELAVSGVDN